MTFSFGTAFFKKMSTPLNLLTIAVVLSALLWNAGVAEIDDTPSGGEKAPAMLHHPYTELLQKYVAQTRFDYDGIFNNKADLQQLYDYVDQLEAQNPENWSEPEALAYWINLYNAATLELVLKHYPVKSIKDIGSLFSSPWNKKVVKVAGSALTLNNIENDIIREQFDDARIHFALNCASIGCPPLAKLAYAEKTIHDQLESATANALNDTLWVNISGNHVQVSKIFDWYDGDFKQDAGSVRAFIARYRPDHRDLIINPETKLSYKDYDWKLNIVKKR